MKISIGIDTVNRIDRIQRTVADLGMKMINGGSGTSNNIVLVPRDEELPCLSRNENIFRGDLDDIENFLHGLLWARYYDNTILKISSQKTRTRVEQEVADRLMMNKMKDWEENTGIRTR